MTPATKTVTVGGSEFQIGRFTARNGSWIIAQIATKMLPAVIEKALAQASGAPLAANRATLSEEEFSNIQGHALAVVRRLENGVPMPVFLLPNTFAVRELEYDLVTVIELTIHALVFNLTPFFEDGGLSQILALLPNRDLSSSASRS